MHERYRIGTWDLVILKRKEFTSWGFQFKKEEKKLIESRTETVQDSYNNIVLEELDGRLSKFG